MNKFFSCLLFLAGLLSIGISSAAAQNDPQTVRASIQLMKNNDLLLNLSPAIDTRMPFPVQWAYGKGKHVPLPGGGQPPKESTSIAVTVSVVPLPSGLTQVTFSSSVSLFSEDVGSGFAIPRITAEAHQRKVLTVRPGEVVRVELDGGEAGGQPKMTSAGGIHVLQFQVIDR